MLSIREWNALDASLVDCPSGDAFREHPKAPHRRPPLEVLLIIHTDTDIYSTRNDKSMGVT